jgi:hypothetical protein
MRLLKRRLAASRRQGATAWAAVDFKLDGWEAVAPWMFLEICVNLRSLWITFVHPN